MVRTQVYLTEKEKTGLDKVSRASGKRQSELIREAVDKFLVVVEGSQRDAVLDEVAGLWKDRTDLPDFAAVRRSWDKG